MHCLSQQGRVDGTHASRSLATVLSPSLHPDCSHSINGATDRIRKLEPARSKNIKPPPSKVKRRLTYVFHDCGEGGDSNAGTADGDTSHCVPRRATNFCCPSTERKKSRRPFGQKSPLKLLLVIFSIAMT